MNAIFVHFLYSIKPSYYVWRLFSFVSSELDVSIKALFRQCIQQQDPEAHTKLSICRRHFWKNKKHGRKSDPQKINEFLKILWFWPMSWKKVFEASQIKKCENSKIAWIKTGHFSSVYPTTGPRGTHKPLNLSTALLKKKYARKCDLQKSMNFSKFCGFFTASKCLLRGTFFDL